VAGAIVDGSTVDDRRAADKALAEADSASYLAGRHALYECGDTGTNVMDLVVAAVGKRR